MKKTNMTLDFKNDHAASLINQSNYFTNEIRTLHYPYKSIQNNSEQCNFLSKNKCNLSSNRK